MNEQDIIDAIDGGMSTSEALMLAKMFDHGQLAKQLRNADDKPFKRTLFTALSRTTFCRNDIARAIKLPLSTVHAACAGRIEGRLNNVERRALVAYLKDRQTRIDDVLQALAGTV